MAKFNLGVWILPICLLSPAAMVAETLAFQGDMRDLASICKPWPVRL